MIPWGLPQFVPMDRFPQGRPDFVAHLSVRGWWDWEDPLPVAFSALAPLFPGAFYDVGANTGFYSILLARLDSRRTVRAFEPVPSVARVGQGNATLAGTANLRYEQIALSDRDGRADLHLPHLEQGMIETRSSLLPLSRTREVLPITCRRLDDFSAHEPVGMIKADVEGAEAAVLAGAATTLKRDRPLVSIEVLLDADTSALATNASLSGHAFVALRPGLRFVIQEEPAPHHEAPNYLLVPQERLDECLRVLGEAAEQFAALREALAGPDAQSYLDEQADRLPRAVLLQQLAVDRRLLTREREHVDRISIELGALREATGGST